MQKKMDGEGNLYDVDVKEDSEVTVVTTFSTASFKIDFKHKEGKDTVVQKFKAKLEKKGKLGDYRIPKEEWPARREEFISRHMKPLISKPTGDEYEGSFRALFAKIFPE